MSLCMSFAELWSGNRELANTVPQTERLSQKPAELHPGPAEGRALRRAGLAEVTQRLPDLGGRPHRGSQEPAGLARQVMLTESSDAIV